MSLPEVFLVALALLTCSTLQGCGSSGTTTPSPSSATTTTAPSTTTTTTKAPSAVRCKHVIPKSASDPCFRQCNQSTECTKAACANLGNIGCDGTRCERESMGATAHCTSQFASGNLPPPPPSPWPIDDPAYLTGFFVDLSLYQPGTAAGFRIVSDKTCDLLPRPDSKSIIMGTDDGKHWWAIKGTVGQLAKDSKSGNASIDFTALDGPNGILSATYNSTGVLVESGAFWTRYKQFPFNFTDAHSGTSQDITGIWAEVGSSSKRTLEHSRMISQDTSGTLGGSLVVAGSMMGMGDHFWHCSANYTDMQHGLVNFEYYGKANFTEDLIDFGTKGIPSGFPSWTRRVPEKPATLVVLV